MALSTGGIEDEYERAMDEGDYIYLAYGQRSPPRDVPPDTRPPAPSSDTAPSSNGLPPGFVPTGEPSTDEYLIERYRMMASAPPHLRNAMRTTSSPNAPPPAGARRAVPGLPPLPQKAGFVPTGDPEMDEMLLLDHVYEHGTAADQREVEEAIDRRMEVRLEGHTRAVSQMGETYARARSILGGP